MSNSSNNRTCARVTLVGNTTLLAWRPKYSSIQLVRTNSSPGGGPSLIIYGTVESKISWHSKQSLRNWIRIERDTDQSKIPPLIESLRHILADKHVVVEDVVAHFAFAGICRNSCKQTWGTQLFSMFWPRWSVGDISSAGPCLFSRKSTKTGEGNAWLVFRSTCWRIFSWAI